MSPDVTPPVTPPATPPDSPDYSQRATATYMVGTYLAANAIEDAYLLVEGPDCAHMKTQYVQGNHDWLSTLTSVSGHHRVANTALHPAHMTRSREGSVRDALTRLASNPATGGVLLTSMPMAFVTGADYEALCREVGEATGKTPVHVPGKSLSGDWLDGYAETLLALARQVDLGGGTPDARKVAIVGHLFDRNEEDQRGNVRELRRLLSGLGLEVVSVWLEGQRFADLGAARDAGLVLSFPYARRAARIVARRTGARLVECALPFGLPATEAWLRQVGEAIGEPAAAEALVERELSEVVPRFEWVVPFRLQGRRFGYVGDPHLLQGFLDTTALVGASASFVVCPDHARAEYGVRQRVPADVPVLQFPRMSTLRRFLVSNAAERGIDLLVSNNTGLSFLDTAFVEFGYPSFHTHCLYDRPFLGVRGAAAFLDTLANALAQHELFCTLGAMRRSAGSSTARAPVRPM